MRSRVPVILFLFVAALVRGQTTRPSTQPTTRPSGVLEPVKEGTTQPAGIPTAQYRDGTLLEDLEGRVDHEKDGAAAFVFEAKGKTLRMIILPNTMLERMETTAASDPRTRFRVNGRATDYRGKNYLWIQDAVIVPEGQ